MELTLELIWIEFFASYNLLRKEKKKTKKKTKTPTKEAAMTGQKGADSDRKRVLRTAVASRVVMFVLCFVFSFFPDFDTSNESYRHSDGIIARLFGSFANWDGVYFSWIAEHGYTYEHFHAFFPLYPAIARVLSKALSLVFPFVQFKSLILVSGFFLSNTCFVVSAVLLHDISVKVLKDSKIAFNAAILYCINPASIFMSSLYTESLFSMLTFLGLRFYLNNSIFVSTIVFMIASFVRSNGIIAAGFIIYGFLDKYTNIRESIFFRNKPEFNFFKAIPAFFVTVIQVVLIFVPYFAIQLYGNLKYGYEPFFNFYGNIQAKYWNQGFLKYFRAKQIPNFILAAPVFVTSFSGSIIYWYRNYKSKKNVTFGFFSSDCIPFIGYMFAISLVAFFCMHVQVATRFILSSSPAIFWWLAYLSQKKSTLKAVVISYSTLYFVLGSIMFTNFYPWT